MESGEGMVTREGALSVKTERKGMVAILENGVGVNAKLEEEEEEEVMSPMARLLRQPGMNFNIVVVLGCGTKIDFDVVKAGLEATMVRHPRFSSIQVFDKARGKKPRWVRTKVDLDKHLIFPDTSALIRPGCSSPDKVLEEYVSSISSAELDPSRPLWELHLLNLRTSEAEAVGIFRIHHSLGDGVSLLSLFLACTRTTTNPSSLPTLPGSNKPQEGKGRRRHWNLLLWAWMAMVLMWNTMVDLLAFAATAMFLRDSDTPLMGVEGVESHPKRIVSRSLDLNDVKDIKNAMGCTINDVLVGVTSLGISRYLERRYGEKRPPNNIRLRIGLFINIRPTPGIPAVAKMMEKGSSAKWGNKVGYVILRLPVMRCQDPKEYICMGMAIAKRKKNSLEAIFTYTFASLLAKIFGIKAAAFMNRRMLGHTTLTFSNMVGPIEEIGFYGHPAVYIAPIVTGIPQALTLLFSSYKNEMRIVMAVDESVVPDPHQLLDDFIEAVKLIKDAL